MKNFILSPSKCHEALMRNKTRKRESQVSRDSMLIVNRKLAVFARAGETNFQLHRAALALELRISEGRVFKAMKELKSANIIQQTQRQNIGRTSLWSINERLVADPNSTTILQDAIRSATRSAAHEAKKDVLRRHFAHTREDRS